MTQLFVNHEDIDMTKRFASTEEVAAFVSSLARCLGDQRRSASCGLEHVSSIFRREI